MWAEFFGLYRAKWQLADTQRIPHLYVFRTAENPVLYRTYQRVTPFCTFHALHKTGFCTIVASQQPRFCTLLPRSYPAQRAPPYPLIPIRGENFSGLSRSPRSMLR
jgi:hypothetical protein